MKLISIFVIFKTFCTAGTWWVYEQQTKCIYFFCIHGFNWMNLQLNPIFFYYFSYTIVYQYLGKKAELNKIFDSTYICVCVCMCVSVIDEHEMANINSICWTMHCFSVCICLLYMKRYNWFHLDLFSVHIMCTDLFIYSFCSVTNIPLFLLWKYIDVEFNLCWIEWFLLWIYVVHTK